MNQKFLVFALIAFLSISLFSCETDFDINAPEKESLAVYCVINPQNSVQYVRVSKVFLTEGNALVYAAENDLSVKNAIVTISDGFSTHTFTPDSTIMKESGVFNQNQTIFRLDNPSGFFDDNSVKDKSYTLEVKLPDDEALSTKATIKIPSTPNVVDPGGAVAGAGGTQQYRSVAFENDLSVRYTIGTNAPAFEIRIWFNYYYKDLASGDSTAKTLRWGPTAFITTKNAGCTGSGTSYCYKIDEKSFTEAFVNTTADLPQNHSIVYDGTNLSEALYIEVTSVNEELYNYMRVNDPTTTDLSTNKPEYSNLDNGAVGVFGAINYYKRYVLLSACSQYHMGLISSPPTNCQ